MRKEDLVAKVLARRGSHPGLVHVLSVVESCTTFKPWRNPKTGQPGLKMQTGKCSTYYFYLIDSELGLMYVRVPTWLPCRLQIYFNVHHWLAAQLRRAGIEFKMEDNSFVEIADWARAQELANRFSVAQWERKFHELAARFCPVLERFARGYHWSVMQVEYSLDLVFKRREQLAALYEQISRHAARPSARLPYSLPPPRCWRCGCRRWRASGANAIRRKPRHQRLQNPGGRHTR